jgi:hypothetical protein
MENKGPREELMGEHSGGGGGQDPHRVLAPVQKKKKKETKYLTVKSGACNATGLWNCGFLPEYRDTYSLQVLTKTD